MYNLGISGLKYPSQMDTLNGFILFAIYGMRRSRIFFANLQGYS